MWDSATLGPMDGIDVGLSALTYQVWKDVLARLDVEWARLSNDNADHGSIWAWGHEEVAERFHPAILRRLAERALDAGRPMGEGVDWAAVGGDSSQWLELEDLLRALRGHREIEECTLLVRKPT